ncbi:hypothetical protein [Staphylothermus hellenicus]|uniref:Uncharacterized protein n=1 Tax=Staphylothermus hellenicus (strain DSM 12710 / JCM 10830 / BK20S6-10-b1 / P8) TaxID=591019 RepID=D7DAY7_STAHD|nr:hypothetical protein [Staphylothermus hellenicus]ADI31334.1 hypothetical protein Shell_0192 [Staphylothermus hellenicus DSM 12710]
MTRINRITRSLAAVAAVAIILSAIVAYQTVFTGRSLNGEVEVQPESIIWYEDPGTPNVDVSIENGLKANITITTHPPDIVLKERHAIYNNTFDQYPSELNASPGCSNVWGWDSTGHYIYYPISGEGWYCYIYPSNIDISSYVGNGSKVYVAAITWRSAFYYAGVFRVGYTFLNDTTWDNYLIGLRNELLQGRTGDNANATAYYYDYFVNGNYIGYYIYLLNQSSLPSGALGFEYGYRHNLSAGMDFSTWNAGLWGKGLTINSSDTLQVLEAHINETYRIMPNRVGVGVHVENLEGTQNSEKVYFDNLVITVNAPPWLVNVSGLQPGWRVVLENSTGGVIDDAIVGSDGIAVLEVWGYLIIPNATIKVYDSSGNLIVNKSFDRVIGGDLYELTGFMGTIINIYSNLTTGFRSGLGLVSTNSTVNDAYVYIYLYNMSGYRVGPIGIRDGNIAVNTTNYIWMKPPSSWSSKWGAGYVELVAYMPGGTYKLRLKQEFTLSPGIYIYGYIDITIRSS